jgi:GAF domain-containing protein
MAAEGVSVEPIDETRALLDLLWTGDGRFEDWLLSRAHHVAAVIPGCVGISIGVRVPTKATFTFVATSELLRTVDAAQYLSGGPCEDAIDRSDIVDADLLSESRWQLAALASAAVGVRSSLSFPIRAAGSLAIGSVNLYGSDIDTFAGPAREVATLFGASAAEAVSNADLAMTGVERTRASLRTAQEHEQVAAAIGLLTERDRLDAIAARQRLEDAAARAGVPVAALAEIVVRHHSGGSTPESRE